MIKVVFFDLDGTLLPMDENMFVKGYFKMLYEHVKHLGYKQDELINMIYAGMKAMYENDGTKTNEEVFWDQAVKMMGSKVLDDKWAFDEFYKTEFYNTKKLCGYSDEPRKIIDYLHKKGIPVALTTNPIFPFEGTKARMSFVNLRPDDFILVTTYENSSYCKPNPKYFEACLSKLGLKPDEVILFGNNTKEDGDCASSLGIKTYLVNGYIIEDEFSTGTYERINMEDIIGVINKHIKN